MSETSTTPIIVPSLGPLARRTCYRFFKRAFDISAALLFIIVLALPMAIVAIVVKHDGGPALFKQERLGHNGKPFTILKFRTMVVNAESDGARWATKDDPRVTRFGKFLRRAQIDEWPQFFNILSGKMTFVGPRPEVKSLHEKFCSYINGFEQRLLVKPGLTGWAQINGGAALLPEQKIIFDVEYIKKQSCWLDFVCLVKTIGVVFYPRGY